eukprot:TRINITY_DN4007_c0_g1_i1.p1 TRINITY_DN4007_c0_g1~~TRINITY_DN4007_c0_g1_i1.p1  ORF type:complete len:193 (+),score=42.68 TRINITY_DN4007_c0_g1_i1:239-817(+)
MRSEYMAKRALEEGNITLPQQFFLIVISLLDPTDPVEGPALTVEKDFFATNNSLGMLHSWPFYGDVLSPLNYTESGMLYMAERLNDWQQDQLPYHSAVIRRFLEINDYSDLPAVVYFHCGHGQDRTGELAGTYELQYLSTSFYSLWQYNINMGMDVVANKNAMMWFCEYWKININNDSSDFCSTTNPSLSLY